MTLQNTQVSKNQSGFTLVEVLVTTSLTVMIMLTITSMFMTFLVSNSKTNIKKVVKEEGLHAMNQIEFILKNAYYLDETNYACDIDMPALEVVSLDGGITNFSNQGGKIASNSASLTSDEVVLSNFNFDCTGTVGNRSIKIYFELQKDAPTLSENESVSESFESTVNIRN
jgi:competence protein ComGC